MRNKVLWIGGLMLLAAVLSACSGVASAQTTPAPSAPRTVSVTGRGEVFLTPDLANIHIGVHTEGEDAAEAMATSNSAQAEKVVETLRSLGVEEKDIQTSNFSIYPQQQFDESGKVTGVIYMVDNTVFVAVRDLGSLGELLNAVVSTGANSIFGIQFDVTDREAALAEARQAAVEDARAQAEELAGLAGVELGEIQSLSVFGGSPIPIMAGKGAVERAAVDAPISPGQLSISVEVNVVYAIR